MEVHASFLSYIMHSITDVYTSKELFDVRRRTCCRVLMLMHTCTLAVVHVLVTLSFCIHLDMEFSGYYTLSCSPSSVQVEPCNNNYYHLFIYQT